MAGIFLDENFKSIQGLFVVFLAKIGLCHIVIGIGGVIRIFGILLESLGVLSKGLFKITCFKEDVSSAKSRLGGMSARSRIFFNMDQLFQSLILLFEHPVTFSYSHLH